jgi:polyisoprenoid-binding protein YceI
VRELLIAACFALPALAQPVRFQLDTAKSSIAIRTGKAGLFSAFGHQHGILATEFTTDICADPRALSAGSVRLRIVTAGLRVDTPEARRAAKAEGSGPGAKDIPTIQEKMLSPANLAAAQYPEVRFESTSVETKAAGSVLLHGRLTIRDRTLPVAIPLRVANENGEFRFQGEVEVRQSDFGIKPESVGGVVKVADQVTIRFDLSARPSAEACAPR